MSDILNKLTDSARKRVESGYYEINSERHEEGLSPSFTENIERHKFDPVVGEIKPGSPTRGRILDEYFRPIKLADSYSAGGAVGFSVLTDPDHFFSSLDNLARVAKLDKPTLMKDFIVDYAQMDAGKSLGADAVLFIYRLFTRKIPFFGLDEGIDYAHHRGLEVLLEINNLTEYKYALETDADMIGINNRDLRSLEVDLSTTKTILSTAGKDRLVWSMSGISSRADIRFLESAGADAFLVGTSLAQCKNPEQFLEKLCGVADG
ncbi:indole-3-glycerol-phosphate synthase [Candidatus Bipolaricaulota bacterium]|nr:indole-3-glycerol-phosphate synthase [Candidatus Bipolaricaulota bacterium]